MSELDPILDSLFQAPFAPAPSLGQLERRRVARRRRRMNARLAAAGLAIVAVIALSRANSGADHTVHTIDGGDRTHRIETTPTTLPGSAPAQRGDAPAPTVATDATAVATPVQGGPLPGAATTTTTAGSAGCAVESQPDAVDVNGPFVYAGTGPVTHQCDFIATQPSGYVGHGGWEVEVYRGGQRFGYRAPYGQTTSCGTTTTIQPGDHVVLTLSYSSDAAADPQYVRAGPDQHC